MINQNIHLLNPSIYSNKFKIFDMKFITDKNILGLVDLSGKLKLLSADLDNFQNFKVVKNFKLSDDSLHSLNFSPNDDIAITGTSNGEVILTNVKSSKILKRFKSIHKGNVTSVKFIDERLFTSADANGQIKVFDIREIKTDKEIFTFSEQSEDISDIEFNYKVNYLLSTSIDGTLAVYDMRKQGKYSLHALSDCIEDELYCMKLVKDGQKVACGTSEGPVVIFKWDWFGDFKDRILGHPSAVNCMDKYDEDFLITGCEDGGVRFVSVYPKYVHSIISDRVKTTCNGNENFMDISNLTCSKYKGNFLLAVCSNINFVKLYDITSINLSLEQRESDQEEENEIQVDSKDSSLDELMFHSDNLEQDDSNIYDSEIENDENLIDNNSEKKERNNVDCNDIDSNSFSDDSDESSSNKKLNKSKKVDNSLKLNKKDNSKHLIEKERRKDFFTSL